jgi:two-component system cell cycle sensor histidine kinase/response regulator CckA
MYPELRVIYMSGYSQDGALFEAAEAGRITFLQKPFTPNDLLQTMRVVLAPPTGGDTGRQLIGTLE